MKKKIKGRSKMEIKIKNTRIIEFFEKKKIDAEIFILKNIDFYEYVSASINENNTTQLMPYIISQTNLIQNLVEKQNKMETSIDRIKEDKHVLMNEITKLRNDNTNSIKEIENMILKNNNEYIDRTKNIIDELEKSISEAYTKDKADVRGVVDTFDRRLMEYNNNLMTSTKEIVMSINTSSDKDIQALTNQIEVTTNRSYNDIKEMITRLKEKTPEEYNEYFMKITNELKQYSNEFQKDITDIRENISTISDIFLHKKSSEKGRVSENIVEELLNREFPMASIERTSTSGHRGDLIIKNPNRPDILIENKEYSKNIDSDEIKKFERDIESNGISGVLLSHNSGISTKSNFQIDVKGKNVLLYIPNCKYDIEKIHQGLDMIYTLTSIIDDMGERRGNMIDEERLKEINEEYNKFQKERNEIADSLIKSAKKLKEIDLLSLKQVLEKAFNTRTSNPFACRICGKICKNTGSLASHNRKHVNENKVKNEDEA